MTLMIMGFWRVSHYPQLMALNVIIIFHYLFIYLTADDNPRRYSCLRVIASNAERR